MNLYQVSTVKLSEKLKELKTWAQVKSPRPLQPALSYALDWLSPELLGSGFRMMEVSDYSVKALVPLQKTNMDYQGEIHQGLVVNSGLELARTFLQKQMPESIFQISASQLNLNKKLTWKQDLELILTTTPDETDEFFIQLQKNKKAKIYFQIKIQSASTSRFDSLELKLSIEKTELIA